MKNKYYKIFSLAVVLLFNFSTQSMRKVVFTKNRGFK